MIKKALPLLLLLLAMAASSAAFAADNGSTAVCRFSNAAFSGYCTEKVTVPEGSTPGKACGEILDCLNSTGCTKTYCQSTTIREGWKLESVKAEVGNGKGKK